MGTRSQNETHLVVLLIRPPRTDYTRLLVRTKAGGYEVHLSRTLLLFVRARTKVTASVMFHLFRHTAVLADNAVVFFSPLECNPVHRACCSAGDCSLGVRKAVQSEPPHMSQFLKKNARV